MTTRINVRSTELLWEKNGKELSGLVAESLEQLVKRYLKLQAINAASEGADTLSELLSRRNDFLFPGLMRENSLATDSLEKLSEKLLKKKPPFGMKFFFSRFAKNYYPDDLGPKTSLQVVHQLWVAQGLPVDETPRVCFELEGELSFYYTFRSSDTIQRISINPEFSNVSDFIKFLQEAECLQQEKLIADNSIFEPLMWAIKCCVGWETRIFTLNSEKDDLFQFLRSPAEPKYLTILKEDIKLKVCDGYFEAYEANQHEMALGYFWENRSLELIKNGVYTPIEHMKTDQLFSEIANGSTLKVISNEEKVDLLVANSEHIAEVRHYVNIGERLKESSYYMQIREISRIIASQPRQYPTDKIAVTLKGGNSSSNLWQSTNNDNSARDFEIRCFDFRKFSCDQKTAGFVSMLLPSMTGKTQAAFALGSRVLYFPLLSTFKHEGVQNIYKPFSELTLCLKQCAEKDSTLIWKYFQRNKISKKKFSRARLRLFFQRRRSFVIGFFDMMMKNFPEDHSGRWMEFYLNYKRSSVTPMSLNDFNINPYSSIIQYQVVFDEFLNAGTLPEDRHVFMFLRNMVRALNMPLILMSTNSRATDLFGFEYIGDGSQIAGTSIWTVVILRLPGTTLSEEDETMFRFLETTQLSPLRGSLDLFSFLKQEAKSNRPGMLQILRASLQEIFEKVSAGYVETSAPFHLLDNITENEVFFEIIQKCATKIRARKGTLALMDGEAGQFDSLLQAKVVDNEDEIPHHDRKKQIITRPDSSSVNQRLYHVALPESYFSFDFLDSTEDVIPHFCLFGVSKSINRMAASLKPDSIEKWMECRIPLNFQEDFLFRLSLYGLLNPPLEQDPFEDFTK